MTPGRPAARPARPAAVHPPRPRRFAGRVWGQDASLSTRDQLSRGFSDLFDLDAVDLLFSRAQGLRTPFLRVAKDGQSFPPGRFTRGGGVGATINDQVDDAALTRLFADGAHRSCCRACTARRPPLIDFAQHWRPTSATRCR